MTGQNPDDAASPGDAYDGGSAPARRADPGRAPTGWHVTRRWLYLTAAVLIAATVVLVTILVSSS